MTSAPWRGGRIAAWQGITDRTRSRSPPTSGRDRAGHRSSRSGSSMGGEDRQGECPTCGRMDGPVGDPRAGSSGVGVSRVVSIAGALSWLHVRRERIRWWTSSRWSGPAASALSDRPSPGDTPESRGRTRPDELCESVRREARRSGAEAVVLPRGIAARSREQRNAAVLRCLVPR